MRLRKVLPVTFLALALPVGAASLAYACTALATLSVTSGAATPGSTVTATGKGFNGGLHGADPATATRTPVVMHWNTRSGPVVASVTPADLSGNLPSFTFTAPNVAPGGYVLIGVQNDPATNTPYYGTPARQSIQIVAGGSRTSARSGAAATAAEPSAAATPAASAAVAQPPAASAATQAAKASTAPAASATGQPLASSGVAPATPTAAGSAAATSGGSAGVSAAAATGPAAQVASATGAAAVTTSTPGLISTSSSERGSVVPAMVLLLLGLGIGLIASARWITSRLPLLRRSSTASA